MFILVNNKLHSWQWAWQIHTFILRTDSLSFIRITAKKFPYDSWNRRSEATAFHPSHLFQAKHAFWVKTTSRRYWQPLRSHSWDKAQVCVNSCKQGTSEMGLSDRVEGEGWRCWRRVLWIRREILPVADSDGANSSTKDRQTGGQPGSLSILF